MRHARALAYVLFAARMATAQSALPPAYAITGVLSSRVDHTSLHAGSVTLRPVARGGDGTAAMPSATTVVEVDEHGRFSIALPSPGVWSVTGSAHGFATQAYQQHEVYSTAVVVSKQHPSVELQLELTPASTIAGVVRDEASEPVRQAQVTLLQGTDKSTYGSTRTDDRGMYLFGKLPPGIYWLKVEAQPWYFVASHRAIAALDTTTYPLDVSYPVLWFPGISDPAQAHPLDLQAGETKNADFQLTPIPSIHLRIASNGGRDARSNTGAPVAAIVRRTDTGADPIAVSLQKTAQGELDLGGLAPGEYEIDVSGPKQNGLSTTVTVQEDRVPSLKPTSTQSDARAGSLFADRSRLRAAAASHGTQPLAAVEGVARSEGKPISGALILLVPTTLGQPGANDPVRCEQTDTEGGFRLADVLPGKYILVAIDDGWHVNWHDPATLSHYLMEGTPLEATAGSVLTSRLEAQKP